MATQDTTVETGNRNAERTTGTGSRDAAVSRRSSAARTALSPVDMLALNPFAFMRRVNEEIDRVFASGAPQRSIGDETNWIPAVEVVHRGGNFVVRAELPGLGPDDVKVEIEAGVLHLEGERRVEREEDQGGIRRTEIRYGRFSRDIPLPENAAADQARANFQNGVLEVVLPAPEQERQRRQIPVNANASSENASAR